MSSKPSHKVFFVQDIDRADDDGNAKPMWREMGVAWSHRSGKGFKLKFNMLPADMTQGEIVMLEATEMPEDQSATE